MIRIETLIRITPILLINHGHLLLQLLCSISCSRLRHFLPLSSAFLTALLSDLRLHGEPHFVDNAELGMRAVRRCRALGDCNVEVFLGGYALFQDHLLWTEIFFHRRC